MILLLLLKKYFVKYMEIRNPSSITTVKFILQFISW